MYTIALSQIQFTIGKRTNVHSIQMSYQCRINFRWFQNEAIVDCTNVIFSTLLISIEMCSLYKNPLLRFERERARNIQTPHPYTDTCLSPKCGHITGCFIHLPENEEGVKACINIDFLFIYIWIAFV